MTKKTKAEVDYSPGHRLSKCGRCKHFRPPDACTQVEGDISPNYWCKRFAARAA